MRRPCFTATVLPAARLLATAGGSAASSILLISKLWRHFAVNAKCFQGGVCQDLKAHGLTLFGQDKSGCPLTRF